MKAFWESRSPGKPNDETLHKSFADTLLRMIGDLPSFGPGEASVINTALKDIHYGPTQGSRISEYIETKLKECVDRSDVGKGRGARGATFKSGSKQTLKCWWNYFTSDELDFFRDPQKSWDRKVTMLVDKGMSVGCNAPEEQTYKWAMSFLLLMHYSDMPSPQQIYAKVQSMKASFVSEKVYLMHEHIVDFPENPNDLPSSIFSSAYPDLRKPPMPLTITGINTVADLVPLRKNSKLLGTKCKKELQQAHDAFQVSREARGGVPEHAEHARSSVVAPPINVAPPIDVDDEQALYFEYKHKLSTLRASKNQAHHVKTEPFDHDHHANSGAIGFSSGPSTGGYVASIGNPEVQSSQHPTIEQTAGPAEKQSALKVERTPDGALQLKSRDFDSNVVATSPAPSIDDLDPYTRAAVQALESRKVTKKVTENARRQAAAAIKRPASADVEAIANVLKRPASAAKVEVGKAKAKNEPTKKKVKVEEPEVKASQIIKAMPRTLPKDGSNPPGVRYKGGIIYTARKDFKFRALKVRGDRYSESSRTWGGKKPSADAWKRVVKSIDDHSKSK